MTSVRHWESCPEQVATSDSSGLLSITSAGRVTIPCEAFPRRTAVVSEDAIRMHQEPVSGQHTVLLALDIRRFYRKSWGWESWWLPASMHT